MAQNSGAEYVSGTFTTPSSGSSYELSFGRTFSKYLIFIEATDASKTAIMGSGQTSSRMFALWGHYPKLEIGSGEAPITSFLERVNPSTNEFSAGTTTGFTYTNSSVTMSLGAYTAGANYLYRGLTYKYFVVEVK